MRVFLRRHALVLITAATLAGCTAASSGQTATGCSTDAQQMLVAELFMGRDIDGGGRVSDADWNSYVAGSLARYFPDGFTVIDGEGQWRDQATGMISHEDTKYVVIAATDNAATHDGLDHVMQDYKTRFHQQSVGLLLDRRCGAF